jgi:hypothetical protein
MTRQPQVLGHGFRGIFSMYPSNPILCISRNRYTLARKRRGAFAFGIGERCVPAEGSAAPVTDGLNFWEKLKCEKCDSSDRVSGWLWSS